MNGRTNRPVWSYKGFPARGGAQMIIKYSIGTQIALYFNRLFPSKLLFYFCSYSCKFLTLYSRICLMLFILKEMKLYLNKINVKVYSEVCSEYMVSLHFREIKKCRAKRLSSLF